MIRILLVDDHAIVRAGYRRLLDAECDMKVVAEAATADAAYACVQAGGIDIVVLDLSLGQDSGLEVLRRILSRSPSLNVLVSSMHDTASFATQALRAGALGYFSKSADPGELVTAIRRINHGERVLSADIAQAVACAAVAGEEPLACLTPREFEVLRMAVRGDSTSGIAERMHLSPKTIHNHLSMVRQKLAADNDFKLLWLAIGYGLVPFVTGNPTT